MCLSYCALETDGRRNEQPFVHSSIHLSLFMPSLTGALTSSSKFLYLGHNVSFRGGAMRSMQLSWCLDQRGAVNQQQNRPELGLISGQNTCLRGNLKLALRAY